MSFTTSDENERGRAALWEYCRQLLFLHEDCLPDVLDWEDYLSFHPMLISPDGLVITDPAPLETILSQKQWGLSRIAMPKTFIALGRNSPSAAQSICNDGTVLAQHSGEIRKNCKRTSVFHPERRELQLIRKRAPDLPPIVEHVGRQNVELQNRLEARRALSKASVNCPQGRIVENRQQLVAYLETLNTPHSVRSASKTFCLKRKSEVQRFVELNLEYPLWVERWIPSILSPNVQWIVTKHSAFPLFCSRQLLDGTNYRGNIIGDIPREIQRQCDEMVHRFIESLEDYQGVVGIDFIVTQGKKVYAIDVNARFNSSTFPFWWLYEASSGARPRLGKIKSIMTDPQNEWKDVYRQALRRSEDSNGQKNLIYGPIREGSTGRWIGYHYLQWI